MGAGGLEIGGQSLITTPVEQRVYRVESGASVCGVEISGKQDRSVLKLRQEGRGNGKG